MRIWHLFIVVVGITVVVANNPLWSQEHEEKPRSRNPLPAQQYLDQYHYVQNEMPDEVPFTKGKQVYSAHRWESIGPSRIRTDSPDLFWDGRVRSFHWYYDSAATAWEPYLGASSGGFWKGRNLIFLRGWTSMGENLPNPSVGAFAIHPQDQNRIIVGTGDWARYNGGGVFYTTDGGGSWTPSHLFSGSMEIVPEYVTDLFYDPSDMGTLWLSSNRGLFKSMNAGSTFYRSSSATEPWNLPIFDMVIDKLHPDTMFVATGYNRELGSSRGIWSTVNAGDSWVHMTAGLPANDSGSTIALDISPSDPNILYAVFTNTADNLDAVYRSTTNGESWWMTTAQPNHIRDGQAGHVNVVRIHPTNPSIVYVGSVFMSKTTDGGNSWAAIDHGHDDITVIDFDPLNPRYVYIGCDGGIFVRDDSLNIVRNDVEYFAPGSLIQAYSFDYAWSEPGLILSGTQDNGTIVSLNGLGSEVEWNKIYGCDGGYANVIDPTDSKKFYFNTWCGANMYRLRSLDQGATIDHIDDTLSIPWYPSLTMNKMFTNFVFTYSKFYLYYSSNNGTTWTRTHSGGSDFVGTEEPRGFEINSGVSGDTLIGYTTFWDSASVRKIKIAGGPLGVMSWRYSNLPDNSNVGRIQVDRWRGQYAYAFSESGARKVFRTTNGGITWASIDGNLPAVFKHTVVSKPGNPSTMYVGTDLGVFRTTNGGGVWHKYQWGLPIVQVVDMTYVPGVGHDTLRIATNGRGYWQRVLDGADPDFFSVAGGFPLHDLMTYGSSGIGLSDAGRIVRTVDGGSTWNLLSTALPVDQSVGFSDDTTAFAVGKAGKMYQSIDAGLKWIQLNVPAQSDLFTVRFINSLTGFAAGNDGVLLRTSDGGQSWQNSTNQFAGAIYGLTFSDSAHGLAAGMTVDANQGKHRLLLMTVDGGVSWFPSQTISGNGTLNDVSFDGASFFIVGDAGYAARSTNGGQSWTSLQLPGKPTTDFHAVSGIAIPPFSGIVSPREYVGGADGSIYVSEDHGLTWVELESGAIGPIESFAYMNGTMFVADASGLLSRSEAEMAEVPFSYKTGWNLLSLPVTTPGFSKSILYPDASSKAFFYDQQYSISESLYVGRGFWLKFPFGGSSGFIGSPIETLSTSLTKGWNIVGAPNVPIPISSITTSPSNIRSSQFYGFESGYFAAETLKPGYGYWMKSSSDGQLNALSGVPKSARMIHTNPHDGHGTLKFVDNLGRRGSLYFSCYTEEGISAYELPPVPPEGAFDVRFASGYALESPAEESERTVPLVLTSASFPVKCTWTHPEGGAVVWLTLGNRTIRLTGEGMCVIQEKDVASLHFAKAESKPTTFKLLQNYPNPFNPQTTIRYELPVASRVTIKVYDMLGRVVATLRDDEELSGIKIIDWNASGVSSGIYFYRLEAVAGNQNFIDVRKMVLIR